MYWLIGIGGFLACTIWVCLWCRMAKPDPYEDNMVRMIEVLRVENQRLRRELRTLEHLDA